jgi:hypothetical protein
MTTRKRESPPRTPTGPPNEWREEEFQLLRDKAVAKARESLCEGTAGQTKQIGEPSEEIRSFVARIKKGRERKTESDSGRGNQG